MVSTNEPWIGIDLGTTNSCVGFWNDGVVEILQNDEGMTTTPSVIAFKANNETIVGAAALNQAPRNPTNTIYDAKRLLGRHFDEQQVSEDCKLWPFKVIDGGKNRPQYVVSQDGNEKRFHPEEISAKVLEKMKLFAERRTGKTVKNAVVTVPAYFNNTQKQATMDACRIAGLECKRIINEPTAASIAYGLNKMSEAMKQILVFDLGGGTLDVSILRIEEDVIEVLATRGDTHLGGQDIDDLLIKHCIQDFKTKFNVDISKNKRAISRLMNQIRRAKHQLSSSHTTQIECESLADDHDYALTLSRALFEQLCAPIFQRCIEPITKALEDAKMTKQQIDEIVLVGGSTRIPKIQSNLSDYFDGKNMNKQLHPDEAVAYGATVQAGILSGQSMSAALDILLLDVTPLSLGIRVAKHEDHSVKLMSKIINRNTSIPIEKTEMYQTSADNQTTISIHVLQGEAELAKDNHKIAKFDINGITPAPAGEEKVDVTFKIDANGILQVIVKDKKTGNSESLTIEAEKLNLPKEEVAQLIAQGEFNREREARRQQMEGIDR